MDKDDLLKVLGIIVLSAVAGYIFLPSLVFNLPFIFIFALIFFPIASAKYNREKMDYSVTGFTVSSTYSFITVYWNAEIKTKSDQVVSPIVSAYTVKSSTMPRGLLTEPSVFRRARRSSSFCEIGTSRRSRPIGTIRSASKTTRHTSPVEECYNLFYVPSLSRTFCSTGNRRLARFRVGRLFLSV